MFRTVEMSRLRDYRPSARHDRHKIIVHCELCIEHCSVIPSEAEGAVEESRRFDRREPSRTASEDAPGCRRRCRCAFLSHVPHAVFRILVDDVAKERPDRLTIPEFLKTYRTFPPSRTYFTVTYRWDQFF